jgi:hypothetical protein
MMFPASRCATETRTLARRGDDEYHHLGEINLGQGWMPVDEERAYRRNGQ